MFWVKIKLINILLKVNGLFHVLFNPKNEFMAIGLIQQQKTKNRTEAARIKSKNRHIGKTIIVPLRSLINDKHWFSSCDWILTNPKTIQIMSANIKCWRLYMSHTL